MPHEYLEPTPPKIVINTTMITGLKKNSLPSLSSFSYLADLAASNEGVNRTLRIAVAEAMVFVGGTIGFLIGSLF